MKKTIKKLKNFIILMLIIVIPEISFTGCTNQVEIEKLAIILAVGFDLSNNNNYLVTIQIIDSNTNVRENNKTNTYTEQGTSIFDALTKLYKKVGERLNYSHIQYIVIGDSMARKGISPIIDFSLRYSEVRPTTPFLVTSGSAKDIVGAKVSTDDVSAFSVNNLLDVQRSRGETAFTTNLNFVNSINHGSMSTTCGLINISTSKLDKNKNYDLSGAAVFNKDKLAGYLSTKETIGFNWIRGNINAAILVVEYPKGNKLSLDVTSTSKKTNIKLIKDKVNIKVNVKAKSGIREMTGDIDPNKNPSIMNEISQRQNEVIYKDIYMAINKAQKDFGLDIFDFGTEVSRKYPNQWDYMDKDWNSIFKNLKINISVDSQVNKTGVLSKPPL